MVTGYTITMFKKTGVLSVPILLVSIFIFMYGCSSGSSEKNIELKWNEENGYRWAELHTEDSGEAGLRAIKSSHTNIRMNNFLPEELMDENRILMNGSGVAAGDIDGDGLVDLYFTRLDGPNKLYRNLGGFKFEDITEQAGVAHDGPFSTGTVFADVNGNGHLDLLITTLESDNVLYLNDGKGNFKLQENSGLESAKGSMTMALADINGDSYPDLYVVNYREINVIDVFPARELLWENTVKNGELIPPFDEYFTIIDRGEGFLPERHEIARKDELYINNGDGTFTKTDDKEVFRDENGEPAGLYPDWGLSAKFQDLNGNGFPDLYVSNDFWTPDRVWINQGDGTFRAIDSLAIRNSSFYSMTVDFSDINRDGYTDIFTVEMLDGAHTERLKKRTPVEPVPLLMGEDKDRPRYNRNSLFLNRGDHTYAEISGYSGLEASEWSWSNRFIDLNLDGYEDVIINTGFAYDFQNLDSQQQLFDELVQSGGAPRGYIEDFIPLRQQNRIFRNNGDLTFTDMSSEWGFSEKDISLGMALADLNGDGTQDVVISRLNDEPSIYKNSPGGAKVTVRLKGEPPNTQAMGAKVKFFGGPVESQTKQIFGGGDYLSGSDPLMVFAADPDNENHEIEITWSDGKQSKLERVHPNRIYEIDQASFTDVRSDSEEADIAGADPDQANQSSPIFRDATQMLNHRHHEDPYDDFKVQPLLPFKLSRQGPGVAFLDVTGDGIEELVIGSGKGGQTGVFSFDEGGSVANNLSAGLGLQAQGDQTGIAGWISGETTHLITGNANYEIGSSGAPSALHIQLENGVVTKVDSLPGTLSTTGPIAAADYNGDGSIDLFIGGRFLPGQYPADARSGLFVNNGGRFMPDRENAALFENTGLVTGALFVDYNRNGEQDLIVTTEWGSVRLFENNGGRFIERTSELGLDNYKGMWQGIAAGDFNNDGYPDLAATNWGENSPYQIESGNNPLRIFYGDFNLNRRLDIIESYFDPDSGGYVPGRKLTEYESIQDILGHIQSNEQFSGYTVSDMLRRDSDTIPYKEVNTLKHMVFLNNDRHGFTATPLPAKAQFSAGFYAGVADMDNDGNEDIFMTQNFFAVASPQTNPRLDAGRGLWLKGDGDGGFEAIEGHRSGVLVYGEQRGAALGDINHDGRTDLVVSQNAAETKLYINETGQRGVSIRLSGPSENRLGIGSDIRINYKDGSHGPRRFVQSGAGYWSQNSAAQVLGTAGSPAAIEVQWFDGTIQKVDFEDGRMDYLMKHPKN